MRVSHVHAVPGSAGSSRRGGGDGGGEGDEPRASWVKHLSATWARARLAAETAGSHSAKSARVWYGGR